MFLDEKYPWLKTKLVTFWTFDLTFCHEQMSSVFFCMWGLIFLEVPTPSLLLAYARKGFAYAREHVRTCAYASLRAWVSGWICLRGHSVSNIWICFVVCFWGCGLAIKTTFWEGFQDVPGTLGETVCPWAFSPTRRLRFACARPTLEGSIFFEFRNPKWNKSFANTTGKREARLVLYIDCCRRLLASQAASFWSMVIAWEK